MCEQMCNAVTMQEMLMLWPGFNIFAQAPQPHNVHM